MAFLQARKVSSGVLTALAAAGYLSAMGGSAACGQWEQIHKLTAYDAVVQSSFGDAVSISGNTIVVGAQYTYDGPSQVGAAFVFDATTGQQLHELTADDVGGGGHFGSSVSISGNIIVIGARSGDGGCPYSGSAFVFDATTGEQLHKLTADDAAAGDDFGCSVSISGDTIVVGAKQEDYPSEKPGAAYLFNATTGEQLHKLILDDGSAGDIFGYAVAAEGNTIVVSAPGDYEVDCYVGALYVFDATTGEQLRRLTGDGPCLGGEMGFSLSLSGSKVVSGALFDDEGGELAGAVYVFDVTTGEQLHRLVADDAMAGAWFGWSVSISEDNIVVGKNQGYGGFLGASAYVFDAMTGEQIQKITGDDTVLSDFFGASVAVSGKTIVVGAAQDDDAGPNSGSAYTFHRFDTSCPADVSGPDGAPDGFVDVYDLLLILAQWGTPGPEGDFTGADGEPDGIVDVHDLLAVLGAWGPCP